MHSMSTMYNKDVTIVLLINDEEKITGMLTFSGILRKLVTFTYNS